VVTRPEWHEDTTDVLHCSMPPQVREHIETLRRKYEVADGSLIEARAELAEARAEIERLRAAEVPLSAGVGFAVVYDDDEPFMGGIDGVSVIATADEARSEAGADDGITPVALMPLTAWSA
jgi:hypothetical protein